MRVWTFAAGLFGISSLLSTPTAAVSLGLVNGIVQNMGAVAGDAVLATTLIQRLSSGGSKATLRDEDTGNVTIIFIPITNATYMNEVIAQLIASDAEQCWDVHEALEVHGEDLDDDDCAIVTDGFITAVDSIDQFYSTLETEIPRQSGQDRTAIDNALTTIHEACTPAIKDLEQYCPSYIASLKQAANATSGSFAGAWHAEGS